MRVLFFILVSFIAFNTSAKSPQKVSEAESQQTSHAKPARYEYYAGFPFWESPIQPFVGETPLTEVQAKTRKHLRVGYDKHNRIIQVQRRLGDQFKEVEGREYELYLHQVHTQIQYEGNIAKHTFYDSFGNQVKVWGDVWTKVYESDEHGRFVKLSFTDENDKAIENSWGIAFYQWKHTADGGVIEERFGFDKQLKAHRRGFEFMRIKLFFASNGHLSLMQNIDESGNMIASASGAAQYRYFYDSLGRFKRWEIYDAKGIPAKGPTGTGGEFYDIDPKGYRRISFFNPEGNPDKHASDAVYWRRKYDEYGNVVELWFTDVNDNPIVCSQSYGGYARVRYIWDDAGLRLKRTEYLDVNGKLMLNADGIAQVYYDRHDNGLLKTIRYADTNGTNVKHSYFNVLSYQLIYDDSNKLVERKPIKTS